MLIWPSSCVQGQLTVCVLYVQLLILPVKVCAICPALNLSKNFGHAPTWHPLAGLSGLIIHQTIQIQYKYHTHTIQIPYKYNTNTIQIPYKYHTNIIQIPYKYHTNTIQIPYKYNTNTTQIQHKYNTNTAQIQIQWNLITIYDREIIFPCTLISIIKQHMHVCTIQYKYSNVPLVQSGSPFALVTGKMSCVLI